jgi:hypothetical protein
VSAGTSAEPAGDDPTGTDHVDADVPVLKPEKRWPVTLAVLVLIILLVVAPDRLTVGPRWLLPTIEFVFLIAVIVTDPGRIDRRSSALRSLGIAFTVVLALGALSMTILLVVDLVKGSPATQSAGPLLVTGGLVWITNDVTFAILYWQLDGGGPAARVFTPPTYPDFAFPQHMNPDLAPPGWRPVFVDYLYLGFTNALAFSPTDAMPMTNWAKLTMAVEAFTSLIILSLVVANAVNVLS